MKRLVLTLILLSVWTLVACGGGEPEPIAQVQEEPLPTVAVVEAEPEPTVVPDSVVEPEEVVADVAEIVEAEPVEEKVFDPDAEYNPPDFDAILASGKPVFINSYADW